MWFRVRTPLPIVVSVPNFLQEPRGKPFLLRRLPTGARSLSDAAENLLRQRFEYGW